MVLDINSLDHKDHAFSNIGCLVGGAFETSGDYNGLDRPLHGGRLVGHIVESLLENAVIEIVGDIVHFADIGGNVRILVHKRRYYSVQHVKGGIAQFLDGEIAGKRRAAVQD
jgi:hypothetical protein